MDSRRAETLEALSAYLQHQRDLLARTQADIERLKKLREQARAYPEQLQNRTNPQPAQANDVPAFQLFCINEKISDLQDYCPAQSLPAKIDWEAFSSSDATPLRSLAIRTRIDHTQRTVPASTQRSPLSFLQKFVKDARKTMLDPVFERLSASADMDAFSNPTITPNPHVSPPSRSDHNCAHPLLTLPPSLSEDEHEEHHQTPVASESVTGVRKRERGRPKARDLKKRRIKTDAVVECKLGEDESDGASARRDIEDDSTASRETPQSCLSTPLNGPLDALHDFKDVDAPRTMSRGSAVMERPDLPPPPRPVDLQRDSTNRTPRTRKPSLRLQSQSLTALTGQIYEPSPTPTPSQTLGKRHREVAETNDAVRKPKVELPSEVHTEMDQNRSETYKQAWSISEQHLLERLLDEIPDGERNRWAKISQAMGGRRTPRQVASRVQKYFEKLKRFGVGVDYKGKAKSY